MKTKKLLSFALVLAMLVGMLPGMSLTASAAGGTTTITQDTENHQGTMTITLTIKAAQTITVSDVTATYGDTDKSVSASVTTPATGGGAISYTVKDGSGDYIDVASDGKLTIKKVPASGKAYVIVKAAATDDYAETTKEVTVTISKAEATVTAKDQSIMVGSTVPDLSAPVRDTHYTVTGLVGTDMLTTAPTLAYQKDGSTVTPDASTVGTYDIVASGASAGDNYNISYTKGTLTISDKAAQTITAADVTATYGDTNAKVSATTDGNGAISYAVKEGSDVVEVNSSTGALTIKKVGTATITVTAAETSTGGTDNRGYASATKDVTVTINKKAVTIKAKDQSIYVGGTVPTLGSDSYTVTGLVGSDTLATNPTLAYSSTPDNTKAGTYTITPSGASAGDNYTITYVNGTLTISRRSSGGDSSSSSSDSSSTSTSTTTTTTTDATSNPDTSTTDGTATVTTTTNRDGSTTEKTTETATKSGGDGSKTEVKAESTTTTKSNTDGTTTAATTSTETATTTAADGTKTVTETKTEAKETLDKSGNGTVEAKTTETVKDESGRVTATTVTESKGTVETATDGTKTTTTTNTAVTTDAAGNKTTVVTTEKATVTTDGNTGKVVSDESGKVVSVEAKVSETAAESAAKSGETVTLPVTVTAAQSAADATAVAITVPKAAESVKVEIPVEGVKPGTVAVIVHEDGTEEIVRTSTTSEGGVVLALESGASVKVVDNTKDFVDVSGGEWYADNVAWASSREVMNGVGNNAFAPNEVTTTGMVAQILMNLAGETANPNTAAQKYSDIKASDWFAAPISWLTEAGIAQGKGDEFGATEAITRERDIVLLHNYARHMGYDTSARADLNRFADAGSVSDWARDAMAWAVGAGIINGTTGANGGVVLDPQGNASRAQVTAMTQRFCEKTAR